MLFTIYLLEESKHGSVVSSLFESYFESIFRNSNILLFTVKTLIEIKGIISAAAPNIVWFSVLLHPVGPLAQTFM